MWFVPTPVLQQDSWWLSCLLRGFGQPCIAQHCPVLWGTGDTLYCLTPLNTNARAAPGILVEEVLARKQRLWNECHTCFPCPFYITNLCWWQYWVNLINLLSGSLRPVLANTSKGEITAILFTRGERKCPSVCTMACYDNLFSNMICLMPLVGASDKSRLHVFILVVLRCSCECMSKLVWGVCRSIAKQSVGPFGI